MKLSIVIAALNDEKNLERCLSAIDALDRHGWELEVVVCDGGSRDRTTEVARNHGAVVVELGPGIISGHMRRDDVMAYLMRFWPPGPSGSHRTGRVCRSPWVSVYPPAPQGAFKKVSNSKARRPPFLQSIHP